MIARTTFTYIDHHPVSSSPFKYANLLNMTIVSNDPIWWPIIDSHRSYSYFIGSWRVRQILVISHSIFIAVAASTMTIYDWGQQYSSSSQANIDASVIL